MVSHKPVNLNRTHSLFMDTLQKIPSIPVSEFLQYFMPSVQADYAQNISPKFLSQHPGWFQFTAVLPSERSEHENVVFSPLFSVLNDIATDYVSYRQPGNQRSITATIINTPHTAPVGPAEFNTRPDAASVLCASVTGQPEPVLHWFNISGVFELKKQRNPVTEQDVSLFFLSRVTLLTGTNPCRIFRRYCGTWHISWRTTPLVDLLSVSLLKIPICDCGFAIVPALWRQTYLIILKYTLWPVHSSISLISTTEFLTFRTHLPLFTSLFPSAQARPPIWATTIR